MDINTSKVARFRGVAIFDVARPKKSGHRFCLNFHFTKKLKHKILNARCGRTRPYDQPEVIRSLQHPRVIITVSNSTVENKI